MTRSAFASHFVFLHLLIGNCLNSVVISVVAYGKVVDHKVFYVQQNTIFEIPMKLIFPPFIFKVAEGVKFGLSCTNETDLCLLSRSENAIKIYGRSDDRDTFMYFKIDEKRGWIEAVSRGEVAEGENAITVVDGRVLVDRYTFHENFDVAWATFKDDPRNPPDFVQFFDCVPNTFRNCYNYLPSNITLRGILRTNSTSVSFIEPSPFKKNTILIDLIASEVEGTTEPPTGFAVSGRISHFLTFVFLVAHLAL